LAGTTLRAALSGARLAKSAAAQDRRARTTFVSAKPASTKPVNPAAASARWPYGNAPAHPAVPGAPSADGAPPADPAIPSAPWAEGMTLAAALAAAARGESATAANATPPASAASAEAESADANLVSSDPTDVDSARADPVADEKTSPRTQPRPKKPSSGTTKPPGSQATHTFAATRSVARKLALQALYRGQLNESPWQDLVLEFGEAEDMANADREYFRELVEGVWGSRQALDTRLAELTDRPPEQLDPVEHAVLLIGLYELGSRPEVPYRVSINEAVGLTKRFGATDGHKFVNAVLDRAARALRPHED
jgi:N utilization substance protein B